MRPIRTLFLALILPALLAPAAASAASPVGVWDTGKANVRIYRCGNGLCGRIVALHEPTNPDGSPMTDANNPDPAKRQRRIEGLHILTGFTRDEENYWTGGRIYNPEDGKTYKCTLTLRDDGTLRVRGYVGIPALGKTQIWTRVR